MEVSWLFGVLVLLIILLWRTIFRNRKITKSEIYRDLFILKNFLHTVLKILSAQKNWKDLFQKKIFFQRHGAFFTTAKPLIWACFFCTKNSFYTFQVWLINFNAILTREMIDVSTIAVIHYFLNEHLFEGSVIESKYIKMTGLQDFYLASSFTDPF